MGDYFPSNVVTAVAIGHGRERKEDPVGSHLFFPDVTADRNERPVYNDSFLSLFPFARRYDITGQRE